MRESVSVNGVSFAPDDFSLLLRELDGRRRQYHTRAHKAKSEGARAAEAQKASRLDELIRVLCYATGAADPSDERVAERRRQRWRE
jgi:hypothetical protein